MPSVSSSLPGTAVPQRNGDDATPLSLLAAPAGQLSGDGQLRELIAERRDRRGASVGLWFLPPRLVERLGLGTAGEEMVVAADPAVITWLQLRFGGTPRRETLSPAQLHRDAADLPPRAPQARLDLAL